MAVASLRQIAGCIGVSGDFSVVRDFFGYTTGVPTIKLVQLPEGDPVLVQEVSVLHQIKALKGKHLHLNLIRVGVEFFTPDDEAEIDAAVRLMRFIYAGAGLGIGRVQRWFITTEEADGHENIGSDCEAIDLMDEWSVPNDALDAFFVLTYAGSRTGAAPEDGPCDKDDKASGVVIAIEGSPEQTGYTLAHETGHYLGLDHSLFPGNLMGDKGPAVIATPFPDPYLDNAQAATIKKHCLVKPGC